MIIDKDTFVHIEKGIDIHLIEYILLYHFDCYYDNYNDPHQDTQHKIGDLSDGYFHFLLYHKKIDKKLYLCKVDNPESIGSDYFFNDREYAVIKGSKLLRNYKINKIKKQLKN